MPNYIQYSTSIPSGSLKKGNAALGITDSVAGPTSTTGWYTGINPPTGSYTVYEVAASGDPDIYCPINSTELINLVKSKGATGGNTGSVAAALAWIATQPNLLATNEVYPNIITSGSVLMLDAGFVGSYPTTASTWYDISGNNNNGSLVNGPTFNINGAIVFDGVDDSSTINNVPVSYLSSSTIDVTFKVGSYYGTGFFALAGYNFIGGDYSQGTTGIIYVNQSGTVFGSLITTSQVYRAVTSISTVPINRYYTATLYKDTTNGILKLYINGKLESSNTFDPATYAQWPTAGTYIGNNNFIIGSYASNNWGVGPYLNGSVASTKLYGKLLSDSEILQNYYQAPIVTNGLVLAVDAGNLVSYESGSTSTYSMTGSISGSLINGTGYNINDGGSWVFDGIDDYIITSSSLLNITTSITLETWLKSTALANASHGDGVNSKGVSSDGNSGVYETLLVQTGGSNYPFFRMRIGSSTPTYFPTNIPINLNQIYHFVSTYDGNTIRIFINGIESGTGLSQTGTIEANTQGLTTGVRFNRGADMYFNGNMFVNRIYNRALTAAEVTQNFNAQKGRFGL